MLPSWFMWLQVATCSVAGLGLLWQRNYWFAWVWFCYALANVGFAFGVAK